MIAFLRRFRRAWIATARPAPLVPNGTSWSPEDAQALHSFLISEHGHRFASVLRDAIAREASSAINENPGRLHWRAGHAAGMQTMVAKIDSLSASATREEAYADDRPDDSLAWLNTAPRTAK